MANAASIEVKVDTGEMCSDALFNFAKKYYETTGIRVRSVSFDWIETPSLGTQSHFLTDVTVVTSSNRRVRG